MMKSYRGKLHLPMLAGVVCALAFLVLLYNERISFLSSTSFMRFNTCAARRAARDATDGRRAKIDAMEEEGKLEYDVDICDITEGRWVYNRSIKPLYSDRSCPYLDRQVSCVKNGRPDSDYRYWQWQPDECSLPRWGSFANGEEGYEELDAPVAYRIGLKTWANWVDSTIDPNKTRVFFTTMSPTHMRPVEWNNKDGIKCSNETRPVKKRGHWGSGSDKRIMKVVGDVIGKMKVPITVLNVTQLSEYRVDAHTKVYTETGGKLLTDEQKADPLHHADCIHWCLPGVPDTWNQIFLAHL
uniref:Trichome birefringence-like C-terminal domain-containing protein n=1 Tax=Chenopodium quinoa TaxID=63459 RepID=A0A803MK77_CHEQI